MTQEQIKELEQLGREGARMTAEDVLARVRAIGEADDPWVQHSDEDELRADVLVAIAKGAPNAAELAAAALTTAKLDFPRWCA